MLKLLTGNQDKKRLLENFFSLSVLQGANYILPLITLPYLVRVLGASKFGLVAFAQAFVQYFIILTDYGFQFSATREIAVNRDDRNEVQNIFNSVMLIKFFFLLVGAVVFVAILLLFDRFRSEWPVFAFSYGMVVGTVLFPVWFYQGMEEMKYITLLNIVSKLFFTLSIFVLIRRPEHYLYVPLLNAIGFISAGLLGQRIVRRRFGIRYLPPPLKFVREKFRESTQFFLSRVSVSIYTSSNAFILGLFAGDIMVGYYAAAEKIYIALQGLYQPVANTLYPYISKERNIRFFRRVFRFFVSANLAAAFLLALLAGWLVTLLFGPAMQPSTGVLRILASVSVVVVPSILLGYPFLAALGYPAYANGSVIAGSLAHLCGLLLLVLLGRVNIYWVACLVFITEFIVLSIRVWAVRRHNLWRLS